MEKIKNKFFLIPLGANAWIAKSQKPQNGSIILVHGNKNEPQGIKMFLEQLPDISKSFKFGNLLKAFTN